MQHSKANVLIPYLAILVFFIAHAIFLSVIAEDSHITYRFAQNLAAGHGPLWNIGEAPIEGYTNFLWVAISALIIKLGLPLFTTTTTLGICTALGSIEITRRYAIQFFNAPPYIALIPAILLAASGPLAAWASSGMETVAFGFFLLTSIYFFTGYWVTGQKISKTTSLMLSYFFMFIATLLRPEGMILFMLLVSMSIILGIKQPKETVKGQFIPILIFVIPFIIYFTLRYRYFGDILPNTAYAKTGGSYHQYLRGLQYVIYFLFFYVTPLLIPVILLMWEKGTLKIRKYSKLSTVIDLIHGNTAIFICVFITLVYLTYIVYVGGDYMAMYRFMVPFIPLIYLLLVPLFTSLSSAISSPPYRKNLLVLVCGITAGATFIHSTPFEKLFFAKPSRQHGHFRGVQAERWHVERLTLIGKYFNSIKADYNESLATRAIGAISYYADMKIDDLTGLADRHIAKVKIPDMGKGWAGHEKMDIDYSFKRLPTYFMFDRMFAKEPIGFPFQQGEQVDIAQLIEDNYPRAKLFAGYIRSNADFINQHYEFKWVWLKDEINHDEGYFSYLKRKH